MARSKVGKIKAATARTLNSSPIEMRDTSVYMQLKFLKFFIFICTSTQKHTCLRSVSAELKFRTWYSDLCGGRSSSLGGKKTRSSLRIRYDAMINFNKLFFFSQTLSVSPWQSKFLVSRLSGLWQSDSLTLPLLEHTFTHTFTYADTHTYTHTHSLHLNCCLVVLFYNQRPWLYSTHQFQEWLQQSK